MAEFIAFEPGIEVNGRTIYSVVDGMTAFRDSALRILAEQGIENFEPTGWYSQQAWLDAFHTISDRIGPKTLLSIGKKIPENAEFPPAINDIKTALAAIDVAYHMNHRKDGRVMFDPKTGEMLEGIGHYHFEDAGDREAHVICENPYPSAFDFGIVWAMAQRFRSEDAMHVSVVQDETAPMRTSGGESCTFIVTW